MTTDITQTEISPQIFRACDIRGVVHKTLTNEVAYLIGLSFGTKAQLENQKTVIIARDGRHSGSDLASHLSQGLLKSGCDVIDIGQAPTPVLYFATQFLNTGTGIMITGSHNPVDYNGFKMMIANETLALDSIQDLYHRIQQQDFKEGLGHYKQQDVMDDYIHAIQSKVSVKRPLKVVVDCGNGVVGILAQKLFESLNCEVIPLYCEVDGDFPNHHPDPGQPANLQDLIQTVIQEKADLGLAFDGDGDRLGLISPNGEIIWPDRLMMLYAKDLLSRHQNAQIIYDVKCSAKLSEWIKQHGGEPIMYKTGHALIKQKMRETGALLSGEMSGHFFFKENWYGFDDACFAACHLLDIITEPNMPLIQEIFDALPNSINTPEINVAIAEEKKFIFIETLKTKHAFNNANLITVDGLRVEFPDGWGLVRASNTTPMLVLRFEAINMVALERIKNEFKAAILNIAPELNLSF